MSNEENQGQNSVPSPGDVPPANVPPANVPPAAEVPPPAAVPPAASEAPQAAPAPEAFAQPPVAAPNPVQPATAPQAPAPAAPQPAIQPQMVHPSGAAPQAVSEGIPQSVPNPAPGVAPSPNSHVPGGASVIPPGMGPVSPNVENTMHTGGIPTPGGYQQSPPSYGPPTLATAVGPDGQQLGPTAIMAPTAVAPAPGVPVPHAGVPQQVASPSQRTIWIFVNRHPFPIHLPHPDDPGSLVVFPPCPDRARHLGMLDFKTHPFFANFVGFKRSISQEPAPAYLQLRAEDLEGAESQGQSVYDIMRMTPDRIAEYVKTIAQSNPEIAQQIANALGSAAPVPAGRSMVSQAPPGM